MGWAGQASKSALNEIWVGYSLLQQRRYLEGLEDPDAGRGGRGGGLDMCVSCFRKVGVKFEFKMEGIWVS